MKKAAIQINELIYAALALLVVGVVVFFVIPAAATSTSAANRLRLAMMNVSFRVDCPSHPGKCRFHQRRGTRVTPINNPTIESNL